MTPASLRDLIGKLASRHPAVDVLDLRAPVFE